MRVRFRDATWDQLEIDPRFDAGFAQAIVKAYRKRLWFMRRMLDERDLRAMRGWRFEPLSGEREGQWSLRLNDQWRLILEFERDGPDRVIVVVGIVDYH
jgi:toxin HigB-1